MTTPDASVVPSDVAIRIAGRWTKPLDAVEVGCTDPRTGQVAARVAGGGPRDATAAVEAASAALPGWSATTPGDRAALLRRIADAFDGPVADELARLTSLDTGKRLAESQAEIGLTRDYFRFFADAATSLGVEEQNVRAGFTHHVAQQPVGVVVAVSPWNFPISIPARKIAPALAAGCPVLLKPSEVTARTSQRLIELIDGVVPTGVVGMVLGDGKGIVTAWLDDPRVAALSFTGSTRVGREIARRGAERFVRLVLELGGSAPFVVLPDADPAEAVSGLLTAKYRNNGQSCIAANTAWVHADLYDTVVEDFTARSAELGVGDPLEEATGLGPLALATDPDRLRSVAADAVGAAKAVTELPLPGDLGGGHYLAPIVCQDPDGTAVDADVELFGPLLPIRRFTDVDDVVAKVSAHRAGLGGFVFGTDLDEAHRVAARLDVGIVGVNTATPNVPSVPFAGRRDSGLGVEGTVAGMTCFTKPQTVAVAHG